ncbi:MAG: ParB/RepB/Spo0J family partition protein [Alphaproteobacteria bacterium]|nr:ParB/RepB/Spo0J family partition protein [Alphaproteobacteria bacterium]
MSANKPRQSLGRGLDALFGEAAEDAPITAPDASASEPESAESGTKLPSSGLTELPVEHMAPSRFQPRRVFDAKQIEELAASIRDKGVLQPLLVRAAPDGTYEIIAGERRWRAAQRAQVHQVPVIIKDFTDTEVLEVALVENLQRADLTPLEEAEGYQRLSDEFGHTQEALAEVLGKSRGHVANMIRLLSLPESVKHLLDQGALSMGHARALIGVTDAGALAKQIVAKGLSVRQVEKLVKKHGKPGRPRTTAAKTAPQSKDSDTRDLEQRIEEVLGLKVDISFDGQGGVLSLTYSDLEQLDDVVGRLTRPKAARPLTADRDPNVLDIEEVLAKRSGALKPDHSEEAAVSDVHPDPRQDDTGSGGSQDRD